MSWTEDNYTEPQGDWGQGSANNTDGWGQGSQNNAISWGMAHILSWGHAITNLLGNLVTEYALQFTTEPLQHVVHPTILPTVGFTVAFKSDWIAEQGQYYMGNDFSTFNNNSFVIWCQAENVVRVNVRTGSVNYIHEFTDLVYGDEIKLKYATADTWEVYKNDVLASTLLSTGFSPLSKTIIWGSYQDVTPPTKGADAKIWGIKVNTETWLLDEQTGTTALGSEGTNLTLYPNVANGGSVDTIWTTATQFTSQSSFLFDYRPQVFANSYASSYYDSTPSQKSIILSPYDNNIQYSDVVNNDGYRLGTYKIGDFNDNMPPVFTDKNIGGIHGWNGYRFITAAHGKTIAGDIYSVWANGGNEIILYNIDGDDLYFTARNLDFGTPTTGTWTHVSGATNTANITLSGSVLSRNMQPSLNHISKKVFIDGVEKVASTQEIYTCTDNARIEEVYNIVGEQAAKDYLVTQQGGGVLVDTNLGAGIIQITNNYTVDRSFMIMGKMKFEALAAIPTFGYTMFLQQVSLATTGDKWYIPKTEPITTGDGTFDLTNLTPYQSLSNNMVFDSTVYEFPTSPPDRQLMVLDNENAVYVHGFLPVLDAAIGTRVNNVNDSCAISAADQKFYMRGNTSDKVGTSLTLGEVFEVYSYRGVIPQVAGRTAAYFVHDYDTGKGYMYADWHTLPVTDSITIPAKYQGKAFTVVEKTSNVTMVDGTLGGSLSVPVSAAHNYGFLTIEIAV